MGAAVLIPIKAFHEAKVRLHPAVGARQRMRLARWTAERVLLAARPLDTYVTCDDRTVAAWAEAHGATVLFQPGRGLNPAVNRGIATLRAGGHGHVIVAHADLARPAPLHTFVEDGVVVLVPDGRDDGTNVIAIPPSCDLELEYGAGSFARHLQRAIACGCPVEVRRDPMVALDIDTPDDLFHPLVQEVLPSWLRTNPASRPVTPRR